LLLSELQVSVAIWIRRAQKYSWPLNGIDRILEDKRSPRELENEENWKLIPPKHHDFFDVLSAIESNEMPPYRQGADPQILLEKLTWALHTLRLN
jgi:hypothetical protein